MIARAFRERARYKSIVESTVGVIFLGTPLRGTAVAGMAQWLGLMRGFMGKETSQTLIKGLQENENNLNNMIQDFAEVANQNQFEIRCFYETRKTRIANAVAPRWIASFATRWIACFLPSVMVYFAVPLPCLQLLKAF